MSLTKAQVREILSKAGVDAEHMSEAVDNIIEGHKTSIDALREERDTLKAEAEKLPDVQKELEELKGKVAEGEKKDPYEPKYNELKEEFDKYKADIEAKEITSKKESAYKTLLKEAGVPDKIVDAILKGTDISAIELTEDGKIKDADEKTKAVKTEWEGYIQTEGKQGAKTPTPPENNGGEATKPSRAAQLAQKYHENLYGKEEK